MKRLSALLLSALLMLTLCAFGEEVVGRYALSESTLRYLLAAVWTREPEAVPLVEAMAKNILLEFGEDGRIQVKFDLQNLNQIMPIAEKIATGMDSGASVFWSEDDGRLLLIAHANNSNASTDLGASLDGDTLMVSYGLSFQRVAGGSGFEGVWEMDTDRISQILAQAGAPAETQRLLSTAYLYLSLNEDGTIGIAFTFDMGSYHDGIVEYTEDFGRLVGNADSATVVYLLDGDTLVLSSTAVVDGIIQSISEKYYRVS